jgi:hypothetical protein
MIYNFGFEHCSVVSLYCSFAADDLTGILIENSCHTIYLLSPYEGTGKLFKLSYFLLSQTARHSSMQECETDVVLTCIRQLLQPSDQTAAGLRYSAKCRVDTNHSWLCNGVNDPVQYLQTFCI